MALKGFCFFLVVFFFSFFKFYLGNYWDAFYGQLMLNIIIQ